MKHDDPHFADELRAFFQRAGSKGNRFRALLDELRPCFAPIEITEQDELILFAATTSRPNPTIALRAYSVPSRAIVITPGNPRQDEWKSFFGLEVSGVVLREVAKTIHQFTR